LPLRRAPARHGGHGIGRRALHRDDAGEKGRAPRILSRGAPAMSRRIELGLLLAALSASMSVRTAAQEPTADTLRLDALYVAAERHDPRTRELALRESQTALHLRSIANERLPSISGAGEAQYQSVVTSF